MPDRDGISVDENFFDQESYNFSPLGDTEGRVLGAWLLRFSWLRQRRVAQREEVTIGGS